MKSILKTLTTTACAMLICVGLSPKTNAEDFNGKVYITISQPMETPGNVILPAGDYTLKRLDLAANRSVVEFFSGDGQKLYNTVMTIPEYRLEPAKHTQLTFYEQQAGQAAAVQSLITEGSTVGVEFIYPRARARQLAMNVSNQPEAIALSDNTLDPVVNTPDVSSTQPDNSVSDNSASTDATPAVAVASADPAPVAETPAADASQTDSSQASASDAAAPAASTQSADPAPATNDPAATTPSTTLPKTAGEQELVLLLGMGCTAGAFALRKIRQ